MEEKKKGGSAMSPTLQVTVTEREISLNFQQKGHLVSEDKDAQWGNPYLHMRWLKHLLENLAWLKNVEIICAFQKEQWREGQTTSFI